MKVEKTSLPGLYVIEPLVFEDNRGYLLETWQARRYRENGIDVDFVQDNHSHSRRGVLRGLHYQLYKPQGKLVYVISGKVFDVAVDIRKGSPTFGKWFGIILSDENHLQLYIPPGFAHGFCVLSDTADFVYKCTDFYDPGDEHGLRWDDPSIGIKWPIKNPVLSQKDSQLPFLENLSEEDVPVMEVGK